MIAIRGLRYRCLAIDALEIAPGITSMIGPNGSGKSTFLKICSGIAEPESGTLLIDNESPRLTGIGYVNEFPDRNIIFPTVKDELASPLRFRFTPCTETERAVRDCAGSLGIGHLLDRRMQDLSGGEKVLVAFAAAIITRPRVIVLDECDSHLDACRCRWLEEALRVSGAVYVIRCTQQMETAALGDHLLYLEKGRVLHAGTPASFSPDIRYVILPALVEVAGHETGPRPRSCAPAVMVACSGRDFFPGNSPGERGCRQREVHACPHDGRPLCTGQAVPCAGKRSPARCSRSSSPSSM